jgi:hypothetical protein
VSAQARLTLMNVGETVTCPHPWLRAHERGRCRALVSTPVAVPGVDARPGAPHLRRHAIACRLYLENPVISAARTVWSCSRRSGRTSAGRSR